MIRRVLLTILLLLTTSSATTYIEDVANYKEIIEHYRNIAKSGDLDAIYRLALCYEAGFGVEKSCNTALKLYKRAASKGHLPSINALGEMYDFGDSCIDSSTYTARLYYTKASELGYAPAMYNLANTYTEFDANNSAVIDLYKRSADKGYKIAEYTIGRIYLDGYLVHKDTSLALHYLDSAAKQDYIPAVYDLGVMYERGIGVEQNLSKAIRLYHKAMRNGYIPARDNPIVSEDLF